MFGLTYLTCFFQLKSLGVVPLDEIRIGLENPVQIHLGMIIQANSFVDRGSMHVVLGEPRGLQIQQVVFC